MPNNPRVYVGFYTVIVCSLRRPNGFLSSVTDRPIRAVVKVLTTVTTDYNQTRSLIKLNNYLIFRLSLSFLYLKFIQL